MTESTPVLEPLSGVDTAWLRMDSPDNLMVIHGVMTFADPLPRERLETILRDRFTQIRRFRQRIVRSGRRYCWQDDPDFDIGRHIIEVDLPEPGGKEELQTLIGGEMARPMPHDYPLWRVYRISNFFGGTALLWRIHHAIGDGVALMVVLLAMTDASPSADATGERPLLDLFTRDDVDVGEVRAYLEEMMPQGTKLMVRPSEALAEANQWKLRLGYPPTLAKLTFQRSDNRTSLKGALSVPKRVDWSDPIPMEQISSLRDRLGGTVNDVLLTATSGGMRRYFERIGHRLDGIDFRGLMPVSLRPLQEMADLGNRFGLIFLQLPVEIEDPKERLEALRQRFGKLKRSLDPLVALWVLRVLGHLPHRLQNGLVRFFGTKATAVVTSVPGPVKTLYAAGQPLSDFFFWVPQSARLGLGISVCSYAGQARLGVAADTGLVEDPAWIVEGFHEELEAMGRI